MVMVCAVAWCKKKQDTKSVHPETKETKEREKYTCTIWGNCEHWWVQKGKDDLADISVIFFLYGDYIMNCLYCRILTHSEVSSTSGFDEGSSSSSGSSTESRYCSI